MLNVKLSHFNNRIANARVKGNDKKVAKLLHKKEILLNDLHNKGLSIFDNGVYSGLPNPNV